MLVQTQKGSGLEIFWRFRGLREWDYPTALRFLSRFRLSRESIPALRHLLAHHNANGVSWRLADHEVLERAARLVCVGRIAVVEYRSRDRWPGTGVVLEAQFQKVILLWRDQLAPARDLSQAFKWLNALRSRQAATEEAIAKAADFGESTKAKQDAADHTYEMGQLRLKLFSSDWAPNLKHYPDAALLLELERALQTGMLIPVFHPMGGDTDAITEGPAGNAPASQRPGKDREDPEGATFNSAHDGSAQGAALVSAAESGAPFCEECEKEAKQMQGAAH